MPLVVHMWKTEPGCDNLAQVGVMMVPHRANAS